MSRLGGFSNREIRRVAERNGWQLERTRGDHQIYRKAGVHENLAIPLYDSLSEALTRRLVRTMGLTVDEFLRQARK